MTVLSDNLKILAKDPKTWVFIMALFGTNGMQAYFNIPVKVAKPPETVVASIEKETTKEIILRVVAINCNGKKKITEHVIEHHGGK